VIRTIDRMTERERRDKMKNQKKIIEKIREARAIRVRAEKLNDELKALKEEIEGMMEVGDSVLVDNVKASLFETTRRSLDAKKVEAWLNKPIPSSCYKETTYPTLKI